jgi:hypothetical protein
MSDIDCPYCGHGQEVCHDDGQGYAEDETHEMECYECEKSFVFTTCISFDYSPAKADCLNGAEHNFKPTITVPRKYTKMRCADCDKTRPCTDAEMSVALNQ